MALPLNMFYNTGIATHVWVLTNRKAQRRKGCVQLIDATKWFTPLRRNLGQKNGELAEADIDPIAQVLVEFQDTEQSKLGFANSNSVSEGVRHSVARSDGEFLRVGVAGRHWETFRRRPQAPTHQGDGVHEGRRPA